MKKLIKKYVMNSSWFRKQMYKAYKHGQEFNMDDDTTEPPLDKCLPWIDWFTKHYKNV